jgi:hypothetical protein
MGHRWPIGVPRIGGALTQRPSSTGYHGDRHGDPPVYGVSAYGPVPKGKRQFVYVLINFRNGFGRDPPTSFMKKCESEA